MVSRIKVGDGNFDKVEMFHYKRHRMRAINIDVVGQVTHSEHSIEGRHLRLQVRNFVEHSTINTIRCHRKVEGQIERLIRFRYRGIDKRGQEKIIKSGCHTNVLARSEVLMIGIVVNRGSDIYEKMGKLTSGIHLSRLLTWVEIRGHSIKHINSHISMHVVVEVSVVLGSDDGRDTLGGSQVEAIDSGALCFYLEE